MCVEKITVLLRPMVFIKLRISTIWLGSRPVVGSSKIKILKKFSNYAYESITIKEDLDHATAIKLYVQNPALPGIAIETGTKRYYPHDITSSTKKLLSSSHIIGYIGKLNDEELKFDQNNEYLPTDNIGKTGIEKFYEKDLLTYCKNNNIKKIPALHNVGSPKSDYLFNKKINVFFVNIGEFFQFHNIKPPLAQLRFRNKRLRLIQFISHLSLSKVRFYSGFFKPFNDQ